MIKYSYKMKRKISIKLINMNNIDTEYKKSRHEAFIKLSEKRVTKALRAIESVGKLSDSKNYVYTQEDVNQLIDAMKLQVEKVEQSFAKEVSEEVLFKFKNKD